MKFSFSPTRISRESIQSRLILFAILFVFAASIALTLAPAVRMHSVNVELRWQHWIGFAVWLIGFWVISRQANRLLPDRDPYILPIIALISGWGLITLFRLDPTYGFKQTAWLAICLIGFAIGMRFSNLLNLLRRYKYIWLTLTLVLTILTFFFGTNPGGAGPNLWLGFSGIYFQPSEILKVILVAYLAAYLADNRLAGFRLLQLIIPTLLVAGAALVILVVQRDLGTASLFIALYTVVIYLASGKRRFLLISFLVIIGALIGGYFIFNVIQLRVEGWLNPWADSNGRSYQIVQSIIAVANGEIFGRGIGLGSPGVVPVSQSDFIYPSIVEETGLLGGFGIVILFSIIALRGFSISLRASNYFQRYLAAGITAHLISQALLIMGGTIRLLPLTGVTLPFFSYGGSSLITSFFAILLLLMVSNHATEQPTLQVNTTAYFITGTVFLTALLFVALVTSWWSVFRADDLMARNDNPRRFISDLYVQRGQILDRNNTVLAETLGKPAELVRILNYPSLSAVVGYSNMNYGQGGIEAYADSFLRGVEGNSYANVLSARILNSQYPEGANIRLSLDITLQIKADALMSDKVGAMVLMNAQTGEILVMSTTPTFNANSLEDNWESWRSALDSPLLNRATQAQYPIGNAANGLLLAGLLYDRTLPPILNTQWSENITSPNYCSTNPGVDPDWGNMISSGCNAASRMIEFYLGSEEIKTLYYKLGFLNETDNEMADSAIEGTVINLSDENSNQSTDNPLVSPVQMASAYAALINGGDSVTPRLITAYQYEKEDWVSFPFDEQISQKITLNPSGSTTALSSTAIPGWQTSSTVETQTGSLDWFIAGSKIDWKGTPLVLVVALENSTAQIARNVGVEMFNFTINPN